MEYTKELLAEMKNAQLKWAATLATDAVERGYSDDGYDYLTSALALAECLCHLDYDDDVERFKFLCEDHEHGLGQDYACDGICPELWDLKVPTFDDDWYEQTTGGNV